MSGHSKWSTIKRKKGAQDAKRGRVFTKLSNTIAVAVREGGADPETNVRLRLAIEKARNENMPNNNIDRAIARGKGESGGAAIERVTYEGYGPSGVAVLVECATDNRNRTSSEVKSVFSKYGGNLAEPGAVAFQFDQKGVITIETTEPDEAVLAAMDAGAEDVDSEEGVVTVYTPPKELKDIQEKLEADGLPITAAELSFEPQQKVSLESEDSARKALRLLDSLEDLDDVVNTYSNVDIPSDILEKVS